MANSRLNQIIDRVIAGLIVAAVYFVVNTYL